MTVDWSVKLGDMLVLAGFVIGGITFMLTIRSDVNSLKASEGNNAKKIDDLRESVNKLSEATVIIARQDERMKAFERRLENCEDDIRIFTHPGTP